MRLGRAVVWGGGGGGYAAVWAASLSETPSCHVFDLVWDFGVGGCRRQAEYVRRNVFLHYSKHPDYAQRCADLMGRVLHHFVTLVCLIRPLGEVSEASLELAWSLEHEHHERKPVENLSCPSCSAAEVRGKRKKIHGEGEGRGACTTNPLDNL